MRDDIYFTLFKHVVRDTQWLQEPCRLLSGHFGSLIHPKSMHMLSTIMIHAFSPGVFSEYMCHAIQPQLACHRAVMVHSKQITVQVINVRYHKCDLITTTQTANLTIT